MSDQEEEIRKFNEMMDKEAQEDFFNPYSRDRFEREFAKDQRLVRFGVLLAVGVAVVISASISILAIGVVVAAFKWLL